MSYFANLHDNLNLVINQLEDKSIKRSSQSTFDNQECWQKLDGAVKQISSEATKLCLAFSKAPLPDEQSGKQLVNRIEQATLILVSAFYSVPLSQGSHLHEITRANVLGIVDAVNRLILTLAEDVKAGFLTKVQCTGGVWEKCDAFPNTPHTSQAAAVVLVKQATSLVSDALSELQEAQNEAGETSEHNNEEDDFDDFQTQSWTSEELELLSPCVGLIKTVKSLLKKMTSSVKLHGVCHGIEHVTVLDVVCDRLKDVSPIVDNFATVLYAPMDKDAVLSEGEKLFLFLQDMLQVIRGAYFIQEEDIHWMDFLLKALNHNWENIQTKAANG